MRHNLVVGPAGRALTAAAYLGRQNLANSTGLQCLQDKNENFGNEDIPFLAIMIQNSILSFSKYRSKVVLACLLCFHWQWCLCLYVVSCEVSKCGIVFRSKKASLRE